MARYKRFATALSLTALTTLMPLQAFAATEGDGGGLPQFNPDYTMGQVFWTLVGFAVLMFLIKRIALPPVQDVMQDRRQRIDTDLDKAEQDQSNVDEVEAAYQADMAEAQAKSRAMADAVQAEAAAEMAKKQAALAAKLDAKLAEADKEIEAANAAAADVVVEVAGELTGDIAKKLAGLSIPKKSVTSAVKSAAKGA